MRGKIYTLDEMNRALPLIRAVVKDVMGGYRRLRGELRRLGMKDRQRLVDDGEIFYELPFEVRILTDEIREYIRELGEIGLFLKDPETGLVEAYGERDGEIVYFSWKPGEERVRFYHGLFGSHRERKPVPAAV